MPNDLTTTSDARLPVTYTAAKVALQECSRIDECQSWADRAEALASYAKQADDNALRKMADRIQARAIRRCGELLLEIEPAKFQGNQHVVLDGAVPNRTRAATEAGLSDRQRKTALRVGHVPEEEFEEAVESDNPPTITALAERGKVSKPKPSVDLQGRDPQDFAAATQGVAGLRWFVEETAKKISPDSIVRGSLRSDLPEIAILCESAAKWISELLLNMSNNNV